MKSSIKFLLGAASIAFLAKGIDNRLETSYYDISSRKIPESFEGFKIAHISDYHNDPVTGLIDAIRQEAPDIIVMTGDMTHDKENCSFSPAIELIKKLVKISPCFIVSGNHDIWRHDYNEYVSACRELGAYFLQNETKVLERSGDRIYISGMEDVFTKTRMKQTVKKYLKFFNGTDGYEILLFHRANALDYIKEHGFDLILSGHMHGGHVRIPYVGGLFTPLSGLTETNRILFPKYFGGLYKTDSCDMIVNRGLGNPMPVPRFFNRPELGIITLHNK